MAGLQKISWKAASEGQETKNSSIPNGEGSVCGREAGKIERMGLPAGRIAAELKFKKDLCYGTG